MENSMNFHEWHNHYETMPKKVRNAIGEAYDSVTASLKDAGLITCRDDRAEELVAAIAHYTSRCNPVLNCAAVSADEVPLHAGMTVHCVCKNPWAVFKEVVQSVEEDGRVYVAGGDLYSRDEVFVNRSLAESFTRRAVR